MCWLDGNYIIQVGVGSPLEQIKLLVRLTFPETEMLMTGIDFTEQLSRVVGGHTGPKKDFYSATHSSTFKVSGRHILNIWRICRSEFNLTQYTFENVVFHLLHQRYVQYERNREVY